MNELSVFSRMNRTGLSYPVHLLFVLSVGLAFTVAPLGAQVIRGVVLDADELILVGQVEKNAPLGGAEIAVRAREGGEWLTASTDNLGVFNLRLPYAGTYEIRATHPGYLPYEGRAVEVGQEEIISLEVRLGRNVVPLEPLVVVARTNSFLAEFHQRRNAGAFATFLTREEIDARAAGRTSDLLRGMPGVRLRFVRWGIGPSIEMQGGFGTCTPTVWVDGVRVPQSEGTGSSLDDYITPERIEGVEVYSSYSTVPAQYHSGMCGVILIWTRRGSREGGEPWDWKRMLLGFGAAVGLFLWII